MSTLTWIIVAVVLVALAFGIAHWIRRQIASTREELKHVDRSKLRDMDHDAWAEDERERDDWKR